MKLSDYTVLVEQALKENTYPGDELEGLYGPVAYGLSAGGKRLRPALVLMVADAFGGKDACDRAMDAAVGIEMFHNFTLLHDDVMDGSDTRRGRQSVQAKWDINTAILSGDTMLTLAEQRVMMVPDAIMRSVMDAFHQMSLRVYEGQRLDMDYEQKDDVTVNDYLRMVGDKTGALLGASAKIGALIGGASETDAECLYRFGYLLGQAFQMQDDWLDVYGDAMTFGKPIGGDINHNKKSYLLIKGLESGRPEAEALKVAMTLPAGATKVKTVTNIYDKLDMSATVRKDVNKLCAEALHELKQTSLGEAAREPMRLMVEKITGRKK